MVDGDKHPGGHLGVWVVKSSTKPGVGWYLASYNAPNSPSALDKNEWHYWEGSVDDGKWKNTNLTVRCPFEVAPLTPPSSWENSVVLSSSNELSGEYQMEESYNGRFLTQKMGSRRKLRNMDLAGIVIYRTITEYE